MVAILFILLAVQTEITDMSDYQSGNGWLTGRTQNACIAVSTRNSTGTVITIGRKVGEDGVAFILKNEAWLSLKGKSKQAITLHFDGFLYRGPVPNDVTIMADASVETAKAGNIGVIHFIFDDSTFESLQNLPDPRIRLALLSDGKPLTDYFTVYGRVGEALDACIDPFAEPHEGVTPKGL